MPSGGSTPAPAATFPLSEALVRLFESVNEGIYFGSLHGDGDTTLAVNPHLKLMFGHPPGAATGAVRPLATERFVEPEARAAFLEQLRRDGAVTDYLLRLRRVDDSPFWVEVTADLDDGSAESGQRLAMLVRDVSERRRREEQGRDIYNQVLQAEKLAALGQTVSGVAHELNNPLATILTWSERLAGRKLDKPVKRGVQIILEESERAAKIVRNLLTFARKRHTTRSMVDLNQVVRETFALRAYEQRVSNIVTIDGLAAGLPPVFGDPYHLKQVLLNLIINAEQAMLAAHGHGTLITRSWFDAEQGLVILELNDDGPGVPEETRNKIFEPFFTTKDVGKGTGLGLTVAYAIMEDHGGRIRVQSEPGQGASFFIELPVGGADVRPAPSRAAQPETDGGGAAVLMVEDEPALATAVSEALADAGYRVDCAGDGQQALEHVRKTVYDVVICDLKMPRMDGRAFYLEIAKTTPALARRIVFVTGDVAGTDAARFLEDSGCRWLAKPFRIRELIAVIRELVP
ncbi:MAG: response regulator [Acidobacteria bacterium]|nr:response regulator [Acidobacteriota bacterium]